MGLHTGVSLPISGDDIPDVTATARYAESAGFDSVWVGDHLADGRPLLESTLALAAAAAVTTRVRVGLGVLQLALRQPVWAAKQIATLQCLSGGRLVLGVGTGGSVPAEWRAAGIALDGRGRRTDRVLAALPGLLTGQRTPLAGLVPRPGGTPAGSGSPGTADAPEEVTLAPAVPRPPLWIGGGSGRALRRVAEYGDAWLAAATPPGELADAGGRLGELAAQYGRPAPQVAALVIAAGVREHGERAAGQLAGFLSARLGMDPGRAARAAVAGGPAAIAERLDAYRAAGVHHVVLAPFGTDWRRQFDVFAEARQLLADGRVEAGTGTVSDATGR
ncbi:N5,N10-methylene tetrahydromethanopterin reductase [Streptomyces humidus]|uniref:N5,N10-methylene tetrahydromethanopterin reductase n=1 Tax=Streptomyces humidus TaxID=52259 RepID=A0A918FZM7_9ACTN|nr:LLM class flavin-dependent oxidoreductase [Streptomyces humidus]GGS05700.1 N5,N10-methylene tetrahydromethanopterin reductase [Streptomyces humidus]